jgi:hypothetical protein
MGKSSFLFPNAGKVTNIKCSNCIESPIEAMISVSLTLTLFIFRLYPEKLKLPSKKSPLKIMTAQEIEEAPWKTKYETGTISLKTYSRKMLAIIEKHDPSLLNSMKTT